MHRGNFRAKIKAIPPQTHTEPPLPALERKVLEAFDALHTRISSIENGLSVLSSTTKSLKREDHQAYQTMVATLDDLKPVMRDIAKSASSKDEADKKTFNAIASVLSDIKPTVTDLVSTKDKADKQAFDSLSSAIGDIKPIMRDLAKTMDRKDKGDQKGLNTIAAALSDIIDRIDRLASRPEVEPQVITQPPSMGSEVADALIQYIKAPKTICRDGEGNIAGWKVDVN